MVLAKNRILVSKLAASFRCTLVRTLDKLIAFQKIFHHRTENKELIWLNIRFDQPLFDPNRRNLESISIVAPVPRPTHLPQLIAICTFIKFVLARRVLANQLKTSPYFSGFSDSLSNYVAI